MVKISILTLAVTLAAATSASAHGALAIGGNTADAATKGIAVGYATNFNTTAEAEAEALKHCFAYTGAPAETVALCKLVRSFSHEVLVVALDPGPSTPGFGWSIDANMATAERNAMDQCKASSPEDRKSFCEVVIEKSDTNP